MIDTSTLSPCELLTLHARTGDELIRRQITRSYNNPTGDLAEYLFCEAFGWHQADKSNAHYDAIAQDGTKYEIKGRRITPTNKSRQLGALRDLKGSHFEYLAGVLFDEDYSVMRAAIIPRAVIERAPFVERTNSHRFLLRDEVWNAPGVRDVTLELRAIKL